MKKIDLSILLYDWFIELLLKGTKKRVARDVHQYNLFPVLDICCGTGKQCHLIGINEQKIMGLDIDLKMMHYANSKYPHIPFLCADAGNIPLKDKCFNGIVMSYALHDKPRGLQIKMLNEAKRLLASEAKIIMIDFEKPWNKRMRVCKFFVCLIERMAGNEHFRNWRQFLKQGGLRELIKQNGLVEIERCDIEIGISSIVIAKFA